MLRDHPDQNSNFNYGDMFGVAGWDGGWSIHIGDVKGRDLSDQQLESWD